MGNGGAAGECRQQWRVVMVVHDWEQGREQVGGGVNIRARARGGRTLGRAGFGGTLRALIAVRSALRR
jgi:hypothetical protein